MQTIFRWMASAAVLFVLAGPAAAGELTIQIADGRATVIARDVPLRQILAEWARVGNTRVVNGEKLMSGPITLELVDIPEKQALDILLRSAAGYLAAPRPAHLSGASRFDRVIILASSRPPAATATAPPQPFNNRPAVIQAQPQPLPEDDDDGEPGDQGPVPPPGMMPPGLPFPGPQGVDPNEGQPIQQMPTTAPRPGQLPTQPQPTPGMPFVPGRPQQIPPPGAGPGPAGAGPVVVPMFPGQARPAPPDDNSPDEMNDQ